MSTDTPSGEVRKFDDFMVTAIVDLTVTDIIFDPEQPVGGDLLQVTATIKNIGNISTEFGATLESIDPNRNPGISILLPAECYFI